MLWDCQAGACIPLVLGAQQEQQRRSDGVDVCDGRDGTEPCQVLRVGRRFHPPPTFLRGGKGSIKRHSHNMTCRNPVIKEARQSVPSKLHGAAHSPFLSCLMLLLMKFQLPNARRLMTSHVASVLPETGMLRFVQPGCHRRASNAQRTSAPHASQ